MACDYEVLDSEWEVMDDAIVTEAQPRSLLHHP